MGAGRNALLVIIVFFVIAAIAVGLWTSNAMKGDEDDAGTDDGGGGGSGGDNLAPVASFTMSEVDVVAGTNVTFDAGGSYDEDGEVTWYKIDFGDGTVAPEEFTPEDKTEAGLGMVAWHNYTIAGDWIVKLWVKDDEGVQSEPETKDIHVRPQDVILSQSYFLAEAGGIIDEESQNFTLEAEAVNCSVLVEFSGLAALDASEAGVWLANPWGDTLMNETAVLSLGASETYSVDFTANQLAISGEYELTLKCLQGQVSYSYTITINY